MGHTLVEVRISDLARKHSTKVKALVDTGATLSVLPEELASKLGIKPITEAKVETGAGIITLKKGEARISIDNKEDITPVLISNKMDRVLLGVVILESLGFAVDPTTKKLRPTPLLLY